MNNVNIIKESHYVWFVIFLISIESYTKKKCQKILRKNSGEGFEKCYISLHRVRGVKNCQNHPYVDNE